MYTQQTLVDVVDTPVGYPVNGSGWGFMSGDAESIMGDRNSTDNRHGTRFLQWLQLPEAE
ncbi:Hypothetical protein SMAX5B_016258 [Scophthalmus maximus]|uniref:Uncharacterized protein n=1 Tax=Scophthalmus maximus TaxID=52904 RepID=A0A2U9BM59_SCOMX|nr:Hypothetical protein SMAX5B_016258 [Scophthalmus maximus]